MSFGMKQDNEARSLAEDLRQKGYNVKQKTHVHHSTLSGFVKEQVSSGKMYLMIYLVFTLQIKQK